MHWSIVFIAIAAVTVAVFLLDQLMLWVERRGWIYYRKRQPSGGSGVGNALLEVQSLIEPDKRAMIEVREEKREEDDSGAPPDPDEDDDTNSREQ